MLPWFGRSWLEPDAPRRGQTLAAVSVACLWLLASSSAQTIQDPATRGRPGLAAARPAGRGQDPRQPAPAADAARAVGTARRTEPPAAVPPFAQPPPWTAPPATLPARVAPTADPGPPPPDQLETVALRASDRASDPLQERPAGATSIAPALRLPARHAPGGVPETDPPEADPPEADPPEAGPQVTSAGQSPDTALTAATSVAEWLDFTQPSRWPSMLRSAATLALFSLAPAVLLMTTSFVRISVVLGLLRQAIGTQMLPSNQIVTSLAIFLTLLIMAPVWQQVYSQAVVPYRSAETAAGALEALQAGLRPVREFMSRQIELAGNGQDVLLFLDYLPSDAARPQTYDDVPLQVLLPAFMLSELKTGFLIGFQVFLPFLILDLVVSSVTVSMGMMMLPPHLVSLPLKLMLFVLVDGWHLVVGMLLDSFGAVG